jgi:hypothetical protein
VVGLASLFGMLLDILTKSRSAKCLGSKRLKAKVIRNITIVIAILNAIELLAPDNVELKTITPVDNIEYVNAFRDNFIPLSNRFIFITLNTLNNKSIESLKVKYLPTSKA